MTPVTEVDQLKAQNALLLRRLMQVSRERDELLKRIAALRLDAEPKAAEAAR
jgi:hypothetical protein